VTVEAGQILDGYLRALEGELRDLAPSDRAEIILEVRGHFEDARRELDNPSEAQLRNIVERLGAPAEIAAEARIRFGVEPSYPVAVPVVAGPARPGALEIGAVIGWVVWWPVGLFLRGLSPRWSRRDKVAALAVEVGFFALLAGGVGTINLLAGNVGGFGFLSHSPLFALFLLFPPSFPAIPGAAYLGWKLVHPGARAWSPAWTLAGRIGLVVVGGWLVWVMVLGPLTFLLLK